MSKTKPKKGASRAATALVGISLAQPIAQLHSRTPVPEVPTTEAAAPAEPAAAPAAKRKAAIMPSTRSASNVTLDADQWAWLDELERSVRAGGGPRLRQAGVLRGLLRGLQQAGLDLSHVLSEEEVARTVRERMR